MSWNGSTDPICDLPSLTTCPAPNRRIRLELFGSEPMFLSLVEGSRHSIRIGKVVMPIRISWVKPNSLLKVFNRLVQQCFLPVSHTEMEMSVRVFRLQVNDGLKLRDGLVKHPRTAVSHSQVQMSC